MSSLICLVSSPDVVVGNVQSRQWVLQPPVLSFNAQILKVVNFGWNGCEIGVGKVQDAAGLSLAHSFEERFLTEDHLGL
jgi:hypothetical protein